VARERRPRSAGLAPQVSAGSAPQLAGFREDVIAGLSLPQKSVPPKYFYDAAGSRLFERICRLREYYPTRTELALTRRHVADMARFAGRSGVLIEYGTGEGLKTRLLIAAMRPRLYIPVDISVDALRGAERRLQRQFPWLGIAPVAGDFSKPLGLRLPEGTRKTVYFPGSTIGNLAADEALAFLRMTRAQVGKRGAMIVGVDLKKDPARLHAAYNDAKGVTAAFNLNLLVRINRELGGDFVPGRWRHYAFYNAPLGRIEMHLASLARQSVRIGSHRFAFERGETIHTENSCKYGVEEFAALAATAGFRAPRVWTDPQRLFAVYGLKG
jgi:L-histidine Nalpha-methyltransferase